VPPNEIIVLLTNRSRYWRMCDLWRILLTKFNSWNINSFPVHLRAPFASMADLLFHRQQIINWLILKPERFEVLTSLTMKSTVFWDVMPSSLVYVSSLPTLPSTSASVTALSFLPFNLHSSVGITAGWKAGFRFPVGSRDFSLLHNFQIGCGAHPASYPAGTGGFFPGREADHSI
jgi:hypothetical protein